LYRQTRVSSKAAGVVRVAAAGEVRAASAGSDWSLAGQQSIWRGKSSNGWLRKIQRQQQNS